MGKTARLSGRRLAPNTEKLFHNLETDYDVTSDEDTTYNCFAYAAGDTTQWWSPSKHYYWPPNIRRDLDIASLIECFGSQGYIRCVSGEVEVGFEKVALYADRSGKMTHAAKQRPDGKWTSKLGDFEDICHETASSLCGDDGYGEVYCFMKRRSGDVGNEQEA